MILKIKKPNTSQANEFNELYFKLINYTDKMARKDSLYIEFELFLLPDVDEESFIKLIKTHPLYYTHTL
jgi:hypothetical protein